jgi:hypothetical protein
MSFSADGRLTNSDMICNFVVGVAISPPLERPLDRPAFVGLRSAEAVALAK